MPDYRATRKLYHILRYLMGNHDVSTLQSVKDNYESMCIISRLRDEIQEAGHSRVCAGAADTTVERLQVGQTTRATAASRKGRCTTSTATLPHRAKRR